MPISAHQKNDDRRAHDDYPTPPIMTQALIDREHLPGRIWEPACGGGEMVKVFRKAGFHVVSSDIQSGTDFLQQEELRGETIVTNPPYKLASEFVLHAIDLLPQIVAMLLRINFLEGAGRWERIYSKRPPTRIWVFTRRMGLADGRAGSFAHCWFVWDLRGRAGVPRLDWIPLEKSPRMPA